jgi:hypothetical protein
MDPASPPGGAQAPRNRPQATPSFIYRTRTGIQFERLHKTLREEFLDYLAPFESLTPTRLTLDSPSPLAEPVGEQLGEPMGQDLVVDVTEPSALVSKDGTEGQRWSSRPVFLPAASSASSTASRGATEPWSFQGGAVEIDRVITRKVTPFFGRQRPI